MLLRKIFWKLLTKLEVRDYPAAQGGQRVLDKRNILLR